MTYIGIGIDRHFFGMEIVEILTHFTVTTKHENAGKDERKEGYLVTPGPKRMLLAAISKA